VAPCKSKAITEKREHFSLGVDGTPDDRDCFSETGTWQVVGWLQRYIIRDKRHAEISELGNVQFSAVVLQTFAAYFELGATV
jgi:hypothetical protein